MNWLLYHFGIDLEQEDDAASFLGTPIVCNEEMKQEGLINHVIEAMESNHDWSQTIGQGHKWRSCM